MTFHLASVGDFTSCRDNSLKQRCLVSWCHQTCASCLCCQYNCKLYILRLSENAFCPCLGLWRVSVSLAALEVKVNTKWCVLTINFDKPLSLYLVYELAALLTPLFDKNCWPLLQLLHEHYRQLTHQNLVQILLTMLHSTKNWKTYYLGSQNLDSHSVMELFP